MNMLLAHEYCIKTICYVPHDHVFDNINFLQVF